MTRCVDVKQSEVPNVTIIHDAHRLSHQGESGYNPDSFAIRSSSVPR